MLVHPVRLRIVSEFVGGERTVGELRAALPDVPTATLYRHVASLAGAGVLEVVGEREARGPSERVYRVAPEAGRIAPHVVDGMSRADLQRMFEVFAASLIDSFNAYAGSPGAVPSEDGLAVNRAVVNLSPSEREAFGERFDALAAEALALPPAGHRRRYHLSAVVIPAPKVSA